jgi:hypothetical protein
MRSKVKLLMVRRPGVSDATLEARLAEEEAAMRARTERPLSVMRAYDAGDPDLYRVAAGEFDGAERPFDAQVDVAADGAVLDILLPLFDGLGQRLDDVVDLGRSASLAGTEHLILPGAGPLLVTIANRRLARFDHDGFIDYWLDYHGPFARRNTPPEVGLGYRQFHTDETATADLLLRTGFGIGDFDGAAECHYRDADAVRMLMANEAVVDEATVDERAFVDHPRCVTAVLRITPGSEGHVLPG